MMAAARRAFHSKAAEDVRTLLRLLPSFLPCLLLLALACFLII